MSAPRSAVWLLAAAACWPPVAPTASVEQPRGFGHFIGDVLTQRIALDARNNGLRTSSLPPADRAGLWFQRRQPRIETDAHGTHWLVIDYQIINSPRVTIRTELPALSLATESGMPVKISGWPVSISPLTAPPAYANSAVEPLRPDRIPAAVPIDGMRRQTYEWAIALVLVLSARWGVIAWCDRRDALCLPFARALQQIETFDTPDADEGAWICMHHALNCAAGRVVGETTVDRLLAAAPHLLPLRAELEAFFGRSNARFFAGASDEEPFPLLSLCRRLRRIEKRNAPNVIRP